MNTIVDKAQIVAKVKTIFQEKLGIEEAVLVPNASFHNDLGLDSLDIVETFMAIEKEFGLRITDDDAEKLTTVGSVTNYVLERVH